MTSVADRRLTGRARVLLPVMLIVLVTLTVVRLSAPAAGPVAGEFTGGSMGTVYTVKLGAGDGIDTATVRETIERALETVDGLMSTYRAESEVSRLNAHPVGEPFPLSPATMDVLLAARTIHDRSRGAFDPTVAALVDVWGFGPSAPAAPPDDETVARLRALVGFAHLDLDSAARTATKRRALAIDLSAIAKGYAVDRVGAALEATGIADYLVEIGGEIKGKGTRGDGTRWRIGIEAPTPHPSLYLTLPLVDMAVATSGDYRNFYEADGQTFAHIVDPRTGRPIRYTGRSISVLHPDAMTADGWATALAVLSTAEGVALAEREDIAALIVARDGDQITSHTTRAFESYRRRVHDIEEHQ